MHISTHYCSPAVLSARLPVGGRRERVFRSHNSPGVHPEAHHRPHSRGRVRANGDFEAGSDIAADRQALDSGAHRPSPDAHVPTADRDTEAYPTPHGAIRAGLRSDLECRLTSN